MSKTLKILLIVLGVIVVIAAVVLLGGKSENTSGLTSATTGANPTLPPAMDVSPEVQDAQNRTTRLLAILGQVSSLTLDTSFLDSGAFAALVDLSTNLPPDNNPGRQNPFLPIGSESRQVVVLPPAPTPAL